MHPTLATLFLMSLGLGTTLTFMSSHWLLAWMGLEISTLAILPMMAQNHHPRAVEATIKYFLVQATAASMLLFLTTLNALMTGSWLIMPLSTPLIMTLMILTLALKMGLAPLHYWLPEVLQGLDLTTGLILSTWQKLAPFILMMQMTYNTDMWLPTALGLASTLAGGWAGLNQTQLRKILAYSSIAHLGWMIIIVQHSPKLAFLALIIYIFSTAAAFLMFNMMIVTKINALALTWSKTPTLTATTLLVFLSLGGLPPLTGFLPKWAILQELVTQELPLTATILALTALLSLYFYLRLCYTMALTIAPNTNNALTPWRLKSQQTMLPLSIMTTTSLTLLPLTPAILAFIY
uniref:NADH-ubiquinone oxidoreductase chain 2 n=1 Tax=Acestrorhynchus sp. NM-2010 TaxID=909829 RepID=F7UIC9_9TELE|nr:NADH dehydrogenase subunit 2 [Acestrorhynchus sp. NM-2010]BAK41993.1 NADH dehydrogenase subunit 2 [Acestrorhynchus sp. NM-2010]